MGAQDSADFLVRAYARLLEVRVLDPLGMPVPGLKRNDLQVRVGSSVRPLVYFEERRNSNLSLVVLIDIGSSMNEEALRAAKEATTELIHLLDPDDELWLAVFGKKIDFLVESTSDRIALLEGINNVPVGGRASFWQRLGSAFGTSALTGPAIDEALIRLKRSRHEIKVVLVFSSAFGNLGPGTEEHLQLSGARFFGVAWSNRLGDAFNLWGDRVSRKGMLRESGGVLYSGRSIMEKLEALGSAMKDYYLLAYDPPEDDAGGDEMDADREVRVPAHPDYRVTVLRRLAGRSDLY